MTGLERNKYKIAGPQTWELVRAAYLAGEPARVVAERYGVTVPAIRRRACKEKWTKRHLAEALEARGIVPPPPPAAPDYVEPHIERAQQRIADDAEREAEITSLVDRIAAEEDASDIAAAIERRALAQASAAMVQGRSKEAQALASMAEMMRRRVVAVPPPTPLSVQRETLTPSPHLPPEHLEQRALAQADAALKAGRASDAKAFMGLAEQMRKRVEMADASRAAEAEEVRASQEEAEQMVCDIFCKAAFIANSMVHAPAQAPRAFLGLVKLWREQNLGEGEADAERAAEKLAASQAAYLEGRFEDTLPEYVRERLQERWTARREALEGEPVIPRYDGA
ncbi:MAG: hypothetical protein KF779_17135 [Hyphomonadaceae bacterium]|nr:hypothetical protein [Hyphomonadaceae bacterium]